MQIQTSTKIRGHSVTHLAQSFIPVLEENVCTGVDIKCWHILRLHTGVYGYSKKESALEVDSGRKKTLPHQGLKPASALCPDFQLNGLLNERSLTHMDKTEMFSTFSAAIR